MAKTDYKILYHIKNKSVESELPLAADFAEILEVEIPYAALGVAKHEKFSLWLSLKIKDMIVDRVPRRGYLTVNVPSETFEAEMWYV